MPLPPSPPGYKLLAPIAEGGMAEVFLAERAGAVGISKIVAVKRLLPGLANDSEFVRMFLAEAKIALDLTHGNIVGVFEFGEHDGSYFLAMEYVRGWNFASVLRATSEKNTPLPPALALFVAAEVAKALAYAHERKGDDGLPLGIVHRDVSPANVLVSVDGDVKLADFGIARAAAIAPLTTHAWVKGKIPYMSPEQARGEPLDARSDLFSLGVVLYELATAKRFCEGREEVAMLSKMRAAERPSFEGLPPQIVGVLDQLITREPRVRMANARAAHQALQRAMSAIDPTVTSDDLRKFVGGLGLKEPLDPAKLRTNLSLAPPPRYEEAAHAEAEARSNPGATRPAEEAAKPSSTAPMWIALATVLAIGAGAGLRVATSKAEAKTRLEVRSATPGALVKIDGELRGNVPFVVQDLDGPVELTVEAPGRASFTRTIDLRKKRDVVVDVTLDPER